MKRSIVLVALVCVAVGFAVGIVFTKEGGGKPAQSSMPAATGPGPGAVAEREPDARVSEKRVTRADAESLPLAARRSCEAVLNELALIRIAPGPGMGRAQYRVLGLLDELAQSGAEALPAIRVFLSSGREVVYAAAGGRAQSMLPPTLRFGLFDVVRQIGGPGAEQLLAENLGGTAGAEFSYVAQMLEEIAPGKYPDAILSSARALLSSGKLADASARSSVYDVLLQYKDTSYVATAQANLVQADGKVDRGALRYLQNALGADSLNAASQTFQDPRITDPESKEALGRLALSFVGANDRALDLYHKATMDPQLTPGQRRNLIEDLNEDGLINKKTPTPEDLKVIANRYTLTQTYLQQDYVRNDKLLNDAFMEADKDLRNMLQRAGALPSSPPQR